MPAERPDEGYLFDLYRQYIGEPDGRTDVYLGFGVFLGGIGLAAVALALFLYSNTLEVRSTAHATWAQPAYAMAMAALPLVMLGIVVLLPSERRVLYASIGGVFVTLLAVGGFLYAYPNDWNGYGADYTAEVIAVYAIGLTGLTASTGAALIAHYLEMFEQAQVDEAADENAESYSDEEIRSDIDEAMTGVELSWGGVQKTEHRKLRFSDNEFDSVEVGDSATTTRSTGVDAQVAGLKGLKGGDTKTTTSSSSVDDQTAKLRQLREQKRNEREAIARDGPVAKLKRVLAAGRDRVREALGR